MRRMLARLRREAVRTTALLVVSLLVAVSTAAQEPHAVNVKPVSLAENLAPGARVGRLRFLGMLEIPGAMYNGVRLSQLSDIAWDEATATLYAVSDKGVLFHLHPLIRDGFLVGLSISGAFPLRELKNGEPLRYKRADSEGIAIMRSGAADKNIELLVSFERFPRVVRYRPDGYAVAEETLPSVLANPRSYTDENRMLESVCYDSRFGVLTMPETPLRNEGVGYDRLYSLSGRSWPYPLAAGSRVVSLVCRGNGEVLVLENDFGTHFWRSSVAIKRIRLKDAAAGDAPLAVQTLFTLDGGEGYQIDNFEGLAHHRGNRYFMVSDNNDFFLQRTLLLYFELLDE
ncbi:MAG: esterase-like activity of phytase family protein [Sulfurifustaceae bacterium]